MRDFESDWVDPAEDENVREGYVRRLFRGQVLPPGPLWMWLVVAAAGVAGLAIPLVRFGGAANPFVLIFFTSVAWFGFRTVSWKLMDRDDRGLGIAVGGLSLLLGLAALLLVGAILGELF